MRRTKRSRRVRQSRRDHRVRKITTRNALFVRDARRVLSIRERWARVRRERRGLSRRHASNPKWRGLAFHASISAIGAMAMLGGTFAAGREDEYDRNGSLIFRL